MWKAFLCLYRSLLNQSKKTRVRFRTQEGTDAYNSLFFCNLCLEQTKNRYTFAPVKTQYFGTNLKYNNKY